MSNGTSDENNKALSEMFGKADKTNGNGKKRKIMLVIEDIDNDQFNFTVEGDKERLGSKAVGLVPSAAEYWAIQFLEACQQVLKQGNAKKLNREERRGSR